MRLGPQLVRFYDPTTGTFLTRDPANALTRSAYGYVYDNPLNLSDPSGLAPCRNGYIPGGGCDASGNPTPPPASRFPILDLLRKCNLTDAAAGEAAEAQVERERAEAIDAYIGPSGTRLPLPIALAGGDPLGPDGPMSQGQADKLGGATGAIGGAVEGGAIGAVVGTFACAWTVFAFWVCTAVGAGTGAVIGGVAGYLLDPATPVGGG